MWATLIFAGTAMLFLVMTVVVLWHLRWVRRLPRLEFSRGPGPSVSAPEQVIRCAVVIAARNEEARIEQTLRHLLVQHGVEVELIVVDDRSSDRTSEILQRLANEDARVKVKRVDTLPGDWLGKCHACHVGASAATGDWILFTDADCWMAPDLITRALRVAARDRADHITLASGLSSKSPGLQASHLVFLMGTAHWFSRANRDHVKAGLGFGAFNLVRAAAYQQCGGYQALRLTVMDDVKLGWLLRRAGRRTRAFIGSDDVEAHWGTSVFSIVKIMEKNYFAALDFHTGLALAISLAMVVGFCIVLAGLISGTAAGIMAGLSPLLLILPAGILARRLGWSWLCAVLTPFMFPLFLWALLNSTFVTLRQRGIRWRDTFYPLETLRTGKVR